MKNNNGYYQTAKDLTNNQDTSLKKQLEQLIPEAFLDGVLDLNSLKKLLENNEINFDEKQNNLFGLYWNGKSKARVNAFNNLNTKTLIPVREKSLNFDSANNIVIEGDNLEVLKTLEASYHNQVDVIYIDPPYNTGNDFVYNDDFKESSTEYKLNNALIDEEGLKTTTNQKTHGRFHTKWLNMIYPRLILARKLLKDTGVIFISIDDNECARLKLICDEIFGEENFVVTFVWQKKNSGSGDDTKYVKKLTEYILMYSKDIKKISIKKQIRELNTGEYSESDEYVNDRGKHKLNQLDRASLTWSEKLDYEISFENKTYYPGGVSKEEWLKRKVNHAIKDWQWRWSYDKVLWGIENKFIVFKNNKIYTKQYQFVDNENNFIERESPFSNLILNNEISGSTGTNDLKKIFDNIKVFDHPKPIDLIKHLVNLHTNKDGLILDFFAGSGTTAQAVMELNKQDNENWKYILIQLPELVENNNEFKTVSDITTARIKRSIDKYNYKDKGFKYFKLTDSHFKTWKLFSNSKNEEFHQQLNLYEDESTKQNQPEDILYEIILKQGLPLDLDILIKKYNNYSYWTDNFFEYLFLLNFVKEFNDAVINDFLEIIKSTVKESKTGNELRVFMLEDFFKIKNGDEHKINLCEQIKMLGGGVYKIKLYIL